MDPGIQSGVTLPDPAPVINISFDDEDAADWAVIGEPGLAPDVLQLFYPLAVPQYPVTPTYSRVEVTVRKPGFSSQEFSELSMSELFQRVHANGCYHAGVLRFFFDFVVSPA